MARSPHQLKEGIDSVQIGIYPFEDLEPPGLLTDDAGFAAATLTEALRVLRDSIPEAVGKVTLKILPHHLVRAAALDFRYGNISFIRGGGPSTLHAFVPFAHEVSQDIITTIMPYDDTNQEIIDLIAAAGA